MARFGAVISRNSKLVNRKSIGSKEGNFVNPAKGKPPDWQGLFSAGNPERIFKAVGFLLNQVPETESITKAFVGLFPGRKC